jgi:hypothetical protein
MLKRNIIYVLSLFLTVATFFSCGNAVEPDLNNYPIPEYNLEIPYFALEKVVRFSIDIDGEVFETFGSYQTTECVVGDTLVLCGGIEGYDHGHNKSIPKSVIARLTTSKGDIEYVKIGVNVNGYNTSEFPPPPWGYFAYLLPERMYTRLPKEISRFPNLRTKITSKCIPRNGILSISPDGDIITAEIITKNKILTTTLNVRSK